jgi:hypothetical protein
MKCVGTDKNTDNFLPVTGLSTNKVTSDANAIAPERGLIYTLPGSSEAALRSASHGENRGFESPRERQ